MELPLAQIFPIAKLHKTIHHSWMEQFSDVQALPAQSISSAIEEKFSFARSLVLLHLDNHLNLGKTF